MHCVVWIIQVCLLLVVVGGPSASAGVPTDTTLTYQGELQDGGSPANGLYNITARLFDMPAGGTQIGATLTFNNVSVADGLLQLKLDFGNNAFVLFGRWLEISVNGASLLPRQAITRTPYAINTRGITVDSINNVGIGVSSPSARLHVRNGNTGTPSVLLTNLMIERTADNVISMVSPSDRYSGIMFGRPGATTAQLQHGGIVYNDDGVDAMEFRTGGNVTRMMIDSGGNVGIGTTLPTSTLDVRGAGGFVIRGVSTAASGIRFGVYGETSSPNDGAGVFGRATNTDAFLTRGVWGLNDGDEGYGVHGQALSTTGVATGVRGETNAFDGRGVHGSANSTAQAGTGVYGSASAPNAAGVWGLASHSSGTNIAVGGQTLSPNGYAAYFVGHSRLDGDVTCEGVMLCNDSVGMGTQGHSIDARLHVQADAARPLKVDRYDNDGELVAWARNDSVVGTVTVAGGVVSYNAFTGSHYAWCERDPTPGTLMRMTGRNRQLTEHDAREIVYGVEPSWKANDPACLGAFLATSSEMHAAGATPVRLIAAVGNGELTVINTGRNLMPGDLLVSSDVQGCAMLDDPARFPLGYVIARVAEPVDWDARREAGEDADRAAVSVLFDAFVRGSVDDGALTSTIERLEGENDELRRRLERLEQLMERMEQSTIE